MSNYITIPINENGIVVDANIDDLIASAMSRSFDFSDMYVYSHGWSLDATRMMDWYNRFSIEFNKRVIDSSSNGRPSFAQPPTPHTLGVGIHWPSMISEDAANLINYLQQLSFYTMEKRADSVGTHGVYSVLRLILTNPDLRARPRIRVNLVGHSFGCKVISSALEQIYLDVTRDKIFTMPSNVVFNVVLLQGAFAADELDEPGCYGDIDRLNLRLLVTHSDLDVACGKWFDDAHLNVNFFHAKNAAARALGAVGPTDATKARLGGADTLSIVPGFSPAQAAAASKRLVVADLTPAHRAHEASDPASNDRWAGHHSDIFLPEIYNLIAGFFYNNNLPLAAPPASVTPVAPNVVLAAPPRNHSLFDRIFGRG
jgi:hypothetical protein